MITATRTLAIPIYIGLSFFCCCHRCHEVRIIPHQQYIVTITDTTFRVLNRYEEVWNNSIAKSIQPYKTLSAPIRSSQTLKLLGNTCDSSLAHCSYGIWMAILVAPSSSLHSPPPSCSLPPLPGSTSGWTFFCLSSKCPSCAGGPQVTNSHKKSTGWVRTHPVGRNSFKQKTTATRQLDLVHIFFNKAIHLLATSISSISNLVDPWPCNALSSIGGAMVLPWPYMFLSNQCQSDSESVPGFNRIIAHQELTAASFVAFPGKKWEWSWMTNEQFTNEWLMAKLVNDGKRVSTS